MFSSLLTWLEKDYFFELLFWLVLNSRGSSAMVNLSYTIINWYTSCVPRMCAPRAGVGRENKKKKERAREEDTRSRFECMCIYKGEAWKAREVYLVTCLFVFYLYNRDSTGKPWQHWLVNSGVWVCGRGTTRLQQQQKTGTAERNLVWVQCHPAGARPWLTAYASVLIGLFPTWPGSWAFHICQNSSCKPLFSNLWKVWTVSKFCHRQWHVEAMRCTSLS